MTQEPQYKTFRIKITALPEDDADLTSHVKSMGLYFMANDVLSIIPCGSELEQDDIGTFFVHVTEVKLALLREDLTKEGLVLDIKEIKRNSDVNGAPSFVFDVFEKVARELYNNNNTTASDQ